VVCRVRPYERGSARADGGKLEYSDLSPLTKEDVFSERPVRGECRGFPSVLVVVVVESPADAVTQVRGYIMKSNRVRFWGRAS